MSGTVCPRAWTVLSLDDSCAEFHVGKEAPVSLRSVLL